MRTSPAPHVLFLLLAFFVGLAACEDEEGGGELPPVGDDDDAPDDDDDDATPFGGDDDDALNETPENLLTVVEEGLWTLTPPGGPYTALTGYLNITELQDGALPDPEPPEDDEDGEPVDVSCQLVYAMTGLPAAESCIGCDSAWTVDIYLDDGNPENCYGPERPEDGESRTYAYSQSDLALYLDFQDMGTWLYWYSALQNGDYISFDWTTEIGFTPEEDD